MDANTTKSLRTNASKPLNAPQPLSVEENAAGFPTAVTLKRRQTIITIEDYWRIDDEWWRSEASFPNVLCCHSGFRKKVGIL